MYDKSRNFYVTDAMFTEEDGYIIHKSRPRPSHILGIYVVKSFLNCMLLFHRIFALVF